jgi:hypothetical protein
MMVIVTMEKEVENQNLEKVKVEETEEKKEKATKEETLQMNLRIV